MGKVGPKFYAVRKGYTTGIFMDWASCERAVKGFAGAEFKSFLNQQQAQDYLAKAGVASGQACHPRQPQQQQVQRQQQHGYSTATIGAAPAPPSGGRFFAILSGHQTGVFQGTWEQIKPLVVGYSGASYKGFATRQEAEQHYASMTAANGPAAAAAAGDGNGGASRAGTKRPYCDIDSSNPPPAAFTAGFAAAVAAEAGVGPAGLGQQQQQGELQVTIFFDGGSRNNPGNAGYGYVIYNRATNQQLRIGCKPLPSGSTNNEAEYSGMIAGLMYAEVLGARHVVVKGDSQLAVNQMKGIYRVSSERLLPYYRDAKMLADRFDSFEIQHVYRNDNAVADKLSNIAMDTADAVAAIGKGTAGSTRRQVAMVLWAACDIKSHPEVLEKLCVAESFTDAAAGVLAFVWDSMPLDEVLMHLHQQGWTDQTGGPPEPQSGGPAAAAAGGSNRVQADGGMSRGRSQHTVAVAAVSLGPKWSHEIMQQEHIMQQQGGQQQQQPLTYGAQMLGQPQLQRPARVQLPKYKEQQQQQQQQQGLGFGSSSGAGAVGFDLQRGGQRARARQQHLLLADVHVASGPSSRHRSGASPAMPFCHTTALHVCRGVLGTVQASYKQQQQISQRLRAFNSQSSSSSSSSSADLQRRLLGGVLSQSRTLSTQQMCSTSSNKVQSELWGAELVRCRCRGAGGRDVCGLHPVPRRAGGGPRLRAAAAAGAMVAVALLQTPAGSVRHRQHPRTRFV